MPTETKEINAKVDLLKVSKDVVEHLGEVRHDIQAYVLLPQGQSGLVESTRIALEQMNHLINEVMGMPDSAFMMVHEPAKAVKEEHPNAKGSPAHERQHSTR